MNSYSFTVELLVILVTVLDAISSPVRPRCSLQCAQAYFGWVKAACLCSYCCNCHLCYDGGRFGRVKIVTLRVGAGMKRRKEGRGREEKNTPARCHCSFGSLRTLANGAPDWCSLGEVDWCLSINCKSILQVYSIFVCMQLRERIIQNSEMAEVRAIFNCAVETSLLELLGMSHVLCNEKVKAISTLASGQDLLAVLKCYLTFTSCQNTASSNTFFFSGGEIMLWRVSKCDFSHLCYTERSWHTHWFPVVSEILVGMICPLMQEHFLWPLSKRKALSCGSTRKAFRSFIFVQSVSGSEQLSDFRPVCELMFSCNVVSRWAQLVSFVGKSIFFDLFWGQNKAK